MARKLQLVWRDDVETLHQHYKAEKDSEKRTRLHTLWLLRQGKSMQEVAGLVGVHYRTVQEWVRWYRQGGVAEVLQHRHGGHSWPARRLTAAQEAELTAKASAGEVRTIADGVQWAKQAHHVEYSYWGMRWVFARLGLRLKVPRPQSPQASVAAQEAWKKGG